jgi:hypothetical protein
VCIVAPQHILIFQSKHCFCAELLTQPHRIGRDTITLNEVIKYNRDPHCGQEGGGELYHSHVPHACCPFIPFMVDTITHHRFFLSHKGVIPIDAITIPTRILNH